MAGTLGFRPHSCFRLGGVTEHKSRLSRRVAAIAESATLKVDAKAKALQAQGRPVISYAAGEPDFVTPSNVVDAAAAAVQDPRNYRYTPAAGLPELKAAIAEKTLRDSGLAVEPSQVIVTNGGKQAVFQTIATIVDDGDEVILPSPYWTTYPEVVKLAGGIPVEVFAGADQGYLVTVEQLEAARTPRTKLLVFVSPSNPTGAVYSPEQTAAIGQWALKHGIWVMTDEIYQSLVYRASDSPDSPLIKAISIVEAVPELANQTVLVNGVAKSYAMTGWRLGWMVGPADAIKGAANMQSHLTSNVSNISQRAALAALTGPQETVELMRQAFERRRNVIIAELNKIEGVHAPMPHGAFYAYADVTGLLNRPWGGVTPTSSLELADLGVDDLSLVDLYSCFPVAVEVAAAELGLGDGRDLTVTGGLSFAGGPWSNYVCHSIATMVEQLREKGGTGFVSGNGGFLTKHSFGVYGTEPPRSGFAWEHPQDQVDAVGSVELCETFDGPVTIESYTVMHDHDDQPERASFTVRLEDGRRAWGSLTDPAALVSLETTEGVGRAAELTSDGTVSI